MDVLAYGTPAGAYVKSNWDFPHRWAESDDGTSVRETGLGFNASRSNPIYGASETVQPSGLYGLCLIRAYQE